MKARRIPASLLGLFALLVAVMLSRAEPQARAVTTPPTFGQPTISGIGGVGFEQDIRVDSSGRVYTSVPGALSSDTSWVWRSTDNGATFTWVPASVPLTGKYTTCAGGGDTELATDTADNLYFADLTLQNFSTARSPDQGTTTNCTNTAVPDTAVDRQWYAVDGNPTLNDGTQIGNTIYLVNDEIGPGNIQCPVSGFVNNTLVMYRSPHPPGFGPSTGGAGEAGITFGNPNRITGIGSCNEGIMGNDEVSPVATTTGKLVGGMPTTLATPVKHIYVIHDDASLSKILIGRCFPVPFASVPIANVQDPSGLNCDDLPVANLGDIPAGKSFPTAKTGGNFPTMAIDKAGNLYAVWEQAPTDPDTGNVTGDTVLKYTYSTDEGAHWATPISIPLNSTVGNLRNNVFAFITAGDDGRVDISWVGTPGAPSYPSEGPDSCPSTCDWSVFMTQTLNGHAASPTFTAPILASEHFIRRGSIQTLIGGQSGNRVLGDFFQMRAGLQGEAYISYADANMRSQSHAMVVRQNGGTGLFANATPSGESPPLNSVTDPTRDGRYEAAGTVSNNNANLDIVGSSVSQPAAADCHPSGTPCYRVTMTLNNLNNFMPPGGQDTDTEAVWLTQWLVQSKTDSFGGRNFFAYAESANGGALQCFDGDSGTQRIGGGLALTYPGRIAITAPGACTAVIGQSGTITIDVPLADVAVANPVDASLHEVTASTMSAPAPTECLCTVASPIGVLFNLIDAAKSYTFTRLPSADLQIVKTAPSTGHVGQPLLYTITVTNNGPDNAVGVTVNDQLPKNAGFGSASASQGSCTVKPNKQSVSCNLGDLAANGMATVSIAVKPSSKGTITNTATVSDTSPTDPNTANNTSSATTMISP
jgi:uncharacterized repeat protein (TIGR01451 family)